VQRQWQQDQETWLDLRDQLETQLAEKAALLEQSESRRRSEEEHWRGLLAEIKAEYERVTSCGIVPLPSSATEKGDDVAVRPADISPVADFAPNSFTTDENAEQETLSDPSAHDDENEQNDVLARLRAAGILRGDVGATTWQEFDVSAPTAPTGEDQAARTGLSQLLRLETGSCFTEEVDAAGSVGGGSGLVAPEATRLPECFEPSMPEQIEGPADVEPCEQLITAMDPGLSDEAAEEVAAPAGSNSGPAHHERGHDGEESDDSIREYMSRLMRRVRGDNEFAVEPETIEDERVQESLRSVEVVDDAPPPSPVAQGSEEFMPRSSARELKTDLAALRALANDSARTALHSYARKLGQETRRTGMTYAAVAFGGGLVSLLVLSHISPVLGGVGAAVGFGAAGVMSFVSFVKAARFTNAGAVDAPVAAPAPDSAMPEVSAALPVAEEASETTQES
jgi:hypothetical protein